MQKLYFEGFSFVSEKVVVYTSTTSWPFRIGYKSLYDYNKHQDKKKARERNEWLPHACWWANRVVLVHYCNVRNQSLLPIGWAFECHRTVDQDWREHCRFLRVSRIVEGMSWHALTQDDLGLDDHSMDHHYRIHVVWSYILLKRCSLRKNIRAVHFKNSIQARNAIFRDVARLLRCMF